MNLKEKAYVENIYRLTDKCRNVIRNLGIADLKKLENTKILKTKGYKFNTPESDYDEIDGFAHTYTFSYMGVPFVAEFLFRLRDYDRNGNPLVNFTYNAKVKERTDMIRGEVKKVIVLVIDNHLRYPGFADFDTLKFVNYPRHDINSNTHYYKLRQELFDNTNEYDDITGAITERNLLKFLNDAVLNIKT
jgi:hypothetical protein